MITHMRKIPSAQAEPWPEGPQGRTAGSWADHREGLLISPGCRCPRAGQAGASRVDPCQVSWLTLPPSGHPGCPRAWGWSGQ